MKNRHRVAVTGTIFALALGAGALLGALPADAAPPWLCTIPEQTTVLCVTGSTCAEAQANLTAALSALVTQACSDLDGVCSKTLTITHACHSMGSGVAAIDGYMTYRCRVFD